MELVYDLGRATSERSLPPAPKSIVQVQGVQPSHWRELILADRRRSRVPPDGWNCQTIRNAGRKEQARGCVPTDRDWSC